MRSSRPHRGHTSHRGRADRPDVGTAPIGTSAKRGSQSPERDSLSSSAPAKCRHPSVTGLRQSREKLLWTAETVTCSDMSMCRVVGIQRVCVSVQVAVLPGNLSPSALNCLKPRTSVKVTPFSLGTRHAIKKRKPWRPLSCAHRQFRWGRNGPPRFRLHNEPSTVIIEGIE